MEIEIKGHSGCSVKIHEANDKIVIVKSTHNLSYLDRLCKQAEKQIAFNNHIINNIKTPEVFNIEKSNEYTLVNMEYIYSSNFIEFFEKAGFNQIDQFINSLLRFIDYSIVTSQEAKYNKQLFISKFTEVKKQILFNNEFKDDKIILELLDKAEYLFNVTEDYLLPIGFCHGDLTLSNILFCGDTYYFIDFLDSFIESPLIDVVKIRQDTMFAWSLMMFDGKYDLARTKIILKHIDQVLDKHFSKFQWYNIGYKGFQVMNLLRILQYSKESRTSEFLKFNLQLLLI